MKRIVLALSTAAVLAAPSTARADDFLVCKNAVGVCVAARFQLTGANGLTVYLFNGATAGTQNMGSVITEWGFKGIGGTNWTYVAATFNDDGNNGGGTGAFAGWTGDQTGLPPIFGGGVTILNGAATQGSYGIQTCDDGFGSGRNTCRADGAPDWTVNTDWAKFTFTYSGSTLANLNGLVWGFKAQAVEGFNGQSIECTTAGAKLCNDTPPNDPPGGSQEVVPEPATMTLLATGLAGMAVANRRRRKQK